MSDLDGGGDDLTPERAQQLLAIANDLPVDRFVSSHGAARPSAVDNVFTPDERA